MAKRPVTQKTYHKSQAKDIDFMVTLLENAVNKGLLDETLHHINLSSNYYPLKTISEINKEILDNREETLNDLYKIRKEFKDYKKFLRQCFKDRKEMNQYSKGLIFNTDKIFENAHPKVLLEIYYKIHLKSEAPDIQYPRQAIKEIKKEFDQVVTDWDFEN